MLMLGSTFTKTFAQSNGFSKTQALDLVAANAADIGLSGEDIKNILISDAYFDKIANANLVYIQQTYKGIPVYNSVKSLAFRNGKVMSAEGSFITKLGYKANIPTGQPEIGAGAAVAAAAKHVDRGISGTIAPINGSNGQKIEFPSYNVSQENITAKLLWVEAEDGKVYLSWQIKFLPVGTSDYWLINVDSKTGSVVNKHNLTVYDKWDKADNHAGSTNTGFAAHKENNNNKIIRQDENRGGTSTSAVSGTYRVVAYPAESPEHPGGTPILVTDPYNNAGTGNPVAALGWHSDGTTDYDYTRGNNVWAKEDRSATNGNPTPGAPATSTTSLPSLTFDTPFDDATVPTSASNQKFAITQLFYWNNIMHDLIYQYGFDEVSGNFQNDNQGRGGLGNDYVNADAQDGSGTNNANFSTPDEGTKPRMQMYLFNARPIRMCKVNSPASISEFKVSSESNVSTANKLVNVGPVTANVALYGTVGNNFGCTALAGTPLAGKIALIDQSSTCTYPVKIKNAQLAGAVGVIMVKNTSGAPFSMTGTDNTITIPAVMVTMADGLAMQTALLSGGEAVNVSLKPTVQLDGDLDNGIVGHEYAHGISNRLTGGPSISSCLTNKEQMGEGWSDYYALMTTTNWQTAQITDGPKPRPMGTYAFDDNITSDGIRIHPYSTSTTINPWTYGMLASGTGGETHNIGEIWTTVLWDMTWALIQANGINPNLYNASGTGGNSIALKLVTEGMKLQACRPGFVDGRNGILKADTLLYNGQYSCIIWKAFANRGLGVKAKQGSSDIHTDQTSDFTLPDAILKKTVDKSIADQNQEITYTLKVSCRCTPISNYKIVDTIDTNLVDYVSGGTYDAALRTVNFTVPSMTEGQTQPFNFTVRIKGGTYTPPSTVLSETVTGTTLPTALFAATATGSGAWSISNAQSSSGPYSFKANNPTTTSLQTLTSAATFPIAGISTLSFSHYYNTEAFYDGGYVELSTNGGITWFDAGPYMYQNGYNSQIGVDSKSGFAGMSNQFIVTKINLSSFKGRSVKIRFVFSSDAGVGGDGWYVDDIVMTNEAGVFNVGKLINASNQLVNNSDTSTLITNIFPLTWGSFKAQKEGKIALLKWTTLQERNTAQFVVERSLNGTSFESIGTVKASGNSNSLKSYMLNDATPAKGINYYRIRQVDNDGKYSYSEVRSLTFENVNSGISITPNPAKDKIAITVPGNKKPLQVLIYSTKGEKVGTFIISGEYNKINLPVYPSGVYFVTISGDEVSSTQKLVIE